MSFPTPIRHVFVVVLENANRSWAVSHGPFERSLQTRYAFASHYYAICHPSAPNYLAMTSGSAYQCGSDAWVTYNTSNLGDMLDAGNRTWSSFDESMPTACDTTNAYPYAVKHNPFVYYSDIVNNTTRCASHDLPFSAWNGDLANGTIPNFAFFTPNLSNDGHDTGVAFADAWLKGWLSPLLNDSFINTAAFFVLYDESSPTDGTGYNGTQGGNVYFSAVSPYARAGFNLTSNASHYNLLSTVEWLLGLGGTGHNDSLSKFPPLKSLFQFPANATYTLTGRVQTADTGLPISAAQVNLTGFPGEVTNSSGGYAFSVTNGSYSLNVTATGYRAASVRVTISGAGRLENVSLSPLSAERFALTADVTNRSTGGPIPGAALTLDGGSPATTGPDGRFVWNVTNGTYLVHASATGFEAGSTTAAVQGGPGWANLSLAPPPPATFSIDGTVRSASTGAPIAGANVSTSAGQSDTSDVAGAYELSLANGSYQLTVRAAGFAPQFSNATVAGSPRVVNFSLQPLATMCACGPHPAHDSSGIFYAGLVGVVVVAVGAIAAWWIWRRRRA